MKSFTSIIFLLLFATALAVPAIIFYTKWANKRADEAALQVPGQNVSTAAIFAGFQDKPPASAEGAGRPALAARPVPSPEEGAAYGGAAAGASDPKSSPRDGASFSPSTASVGGAGSGRTEPGVPVSPHSLTGAYFSPRSDRDPFITPAEYAKIKEDAEKMLEAERKRLREIRYRDKKASGANLITLQGIIGPNAIINGEMYSVGNTVRGVKVKIVKITPTYVIGEYQGKQFTKVMR